MKKAFLNSLPKAGTHLVSRILLLFGYSLKGHLGSDIYLAKGKSSILSRLAMALTERQYLVGIDTPVKVARQPVDKTLSSMEPGEFMTAHVGYNSLLLDRLMTLGFAPLVVVRDPRAVLSSFVHYVRKEDSHILHPAFASMGEEDAYLAALDGIALKEATLRSLKTRCTALSPWLSSPKVLSLRFEDLVGNRGGSSDSEQRKSLVALCEFLDAPIDNVEHIAQSLFGPGTQTFRKGRVDSWKEETPFSIMPIIDSKLRSILDEWGYG